MPLPRSQWDPKRELQNAKFEGYKLSFDDDDDEHESKESVRRYRFATSSALPGRTLASSSSASSSRSASQNETRPGFKEARNRARWNHLSPGRDSQAGWIDSEGSIWSVDLAHNSASPKLVLTIPQPIQGSTALSSASIPSPDYPVLRHLQDRTWVATDGHGRLYIVDESQSSIVATFELRDALPQNSEEAAGHGGLLPFRLLAIQPAPNGGTMALLSSSTEPSFLASTSSASRPSHTASRIPPSQRPFYVYAVRFDHNAMQDDSQPLQMQAILRGSDLPVHVMTSSADQWLIASACTYRLVYSSKRGLVQGTDPSSGLVATAANTDRPEASTDAGPDEIVGTPQANAESEPLQNSKKRPPFSWNQMSDSVTVAFALPSTINAKDIKVVFRPSAVSLTVSPASAPSEFPLPKLLSAKLWAEIDAGISTWTWEKTGGDKGKYGILALHLEKKHEDTRWPYVFKQDDNDNLEPEYREMEETLDRSELANITEALEKYTKDAAAASSSSSAASTGGLTGMDQRSSLLGDEIDLDIDASDGHRVFFTTLSGLTEDDGDVVCSHGEKQEPADLVSLPLARSRSGATLKDTAIVTKYDVDGLLFQPKVLGPAPLEWEHVSTYPALAFVLASKRDVVQVYHYRDQLCMALEIGSPSSSSSPSTSQTSYSASQSAKMNAYLYFPPPPGSKATRAKQKVISLAEPSAGAVLGAITLESGSDHVDVAILLERELVLLRDVL